MFAHVEMIRDGGSWAASFTGDDGRDYILFLQIRFSESRPASARPEDRPAIPRGAAVFEQEWLGHGEPHLIDVAKRRADTATTRHSRLSGEATQISWAEARALITAMESLPVAVNQRTALWLQEMRAAVEREGRVPDDAALVRRSYQGG